MPVEIVMPDKLVMRKVADLLPYARNARTHSDGQVAQIVASMKEFGFTNPILTDGEDGILAGHGRVLAAHVLRLAIVPTIDISHLTPAQRRAYILADNKIALNAGWDIGLLKVELADLKVDGFDLSLTGFSLEELDELLQEELPADKDPDQVPDVPEAPHTVPGDIWLLGAHKVMCNDSTSVSAWQAMLGEELADCVWTDPPYNVAYESKLAGKIKNDDMGDEAFCDFLCAAHNALYAIMKPGAAIYVAHADTEGYNFRYAFKHAGLKLAGCLIWRKDSLVLGRSDYQWQHEPILYGWKPGSAHRWYGGRKQTTVRDLGDASPFERQADGRYTFTVGDQVMVVTGEVQVEALPSSLIRCPKPKRSAEHPTMKPTELIEKQLKSSARPGDIIVDAFGGSGSTLMAADRLGMCARLSELDPKFCDVIIRRWQQYTGRRAIHAVTGAPFPDAIEKQGGAVKS